MNQLRVIGAALDSIGRFRANKYPLKNTINEITRLRNLNSKERNYLYEIAFSWARKSYNIASFLKDNLSGFNSLAQQEKDRLCLKLLTRDPELDNLINKYDIFCQTHKDLALDSMGPLIKSELLFYGQEKALKIAQGLLETALIYLAFDKRFLSLEDLFHELARLSLTPISSPIISSAVGIIEGKFSLELLPKKLQDHVWVMDASSQFVASLISSKPKEKILDMCAGHGNKLKYMTMGSGDFYALEIDENRLDLAKKRIKAKINYQSEDARKTHFPDNFFDWILLDSPCSGTGTIRRHPDIIHRLKEEDLRIYTALQAELLREAIRILRPQGKLVYATCSVLPSENQCQIDKLLKENKNIAGISLQSLINFEVKLAPDRLKNYVLELAPGDDKCDGFFISCLTKSLF